MSFLNSVLKVFVGDKSKQDVKAIMPLVEKIKSFESKIEQLTHDELREKTVEFKSKIAEVRADIEEKIAKLQEESDTTENIDRKEEIYQEIDKLKDESYKITEDVLNDIMAEAFAVVKETAKRFKDNTSIIVTANEFDRSLSGEKDYVTLDGEKASWANSWDAAGKEVTWDMVHYDVQLIGGAALHQGKIAEMQTGEGKTLVATLPVYLNALAEKGVHLVTVNDYLAKRDSAWMAPIFEFHGMSVDCIDYHQPNSDARKKAYNADITYGTNNEFGFDYLRDNMAHSPDDLVQRPHHYAIVDEVDSVLVDDARTPLIISGPIPKGDRHEFNELKPKVDDIVSVQRKYLTGVLAEAKKLIKSDTHLKLESIGYECGFNSKSTFYTAFKPMSRSLGRHKFPQHTSRGRLRQRHPVQNQNTRRAYSTEIKRQPEILNQGLVEVFPNGLFAIVALLSSGFFSHATSQPLNSTATKRKASDLPSCQ